MVPRRKRLGPPQSPSHLHSLRLPCRQPPTHWLPSLGGETSARNVTRLFILQRCEAAAAQQLQQPPPQHTDLISARGQPCVIVCAAAFGLPVMIWLSSRRYHVDFSRRSCGGSLPLIPPPPGISLDRVPESPRVATPSQAREGPNNIKYHKACFTCFTCQKTLDSTYTERKGDVFCKSCYVSRPPDVRARALFLVSVTRTVAAARPDDDSIHEYQSFGLQDDHRSETFPQTLNQKIPFRIEDFIFRYAVFGVVLVLPIQHCRQTIL